MVKLKHSLVVVYVHIICVHVNIFMFFEKEFVNIVVFVLYGLLLSIPLHFMLNTLKVFEILQNTFGQRAVLFGILMEIL